MTLDSRPHLKRFLGREEWKERLAIKESARTLIHFQQYRWSKEELLSSFQPFLPSFHSLPRKQGIQVSKRHWKEKNKSKVCSGNVQFFAKWSSKIFLPPRFSFPKLSLCDLSWMAKSTLKYSLSFVSVQSKEETMIA